MTGFVQGTLFGMEPAIIFDDATTIGPGGTNNETGIKFHGLHKYLNYNANPERSSVTSKWQQLVPNRNPTGGNNNVTQPIRSTSQKAKANANQKARNEANRLAKDKANANQKARNEANRLAKAKAIENQKAKANAANAPRPMNINNNNKNKFIKELKRLTSLNNRTKLGFIMNFNKGQNANILLKEAKRLNNNAKEGLMAIRRGTLRSGTSGRK